MSRFNSVKLPQQTLDFLLNLYSDKDSIEFGIDDVKEAIKNLGKNSSTNLKKTIIEKGGENILVDADSIDTMKGPYVVLKEEVL